MLKWNIIIWENYSYIIIWENYSYDNSNSNYVNNN